MRIMMVSLLPLTLALGACGGLFGQDDKVEDAGNRIAASGTGGTRSYDARDFTTVRLSGSDDVKVSVGAAFAVRAEGDTAVLDTLEIVREGSELRIRRKQGNWRWGDDTGATIFVTMPAIRSAALDGSGDMTIDMAKGDFDAAVAGSGDLVIGQLVGGTARFSIAGSGSIAAAGIATALDLSIAGSGDIDAGGVKASSANVSIVGSGDVKADVTGDATVALMGSGSASLGKGARCKVDKAGSGEATCG